MEQIGQLLASRMDIVFLALVFLSFALVTVGLGMSATSRLHIRRRMAEASEPTSSKSAKTEQITWSAPPEFLSGLMPSDEAKKSELKKLLHSAGYYGTGALLWFQGIRVVSGVTLGMLSAVMYSKFFPDHTSLQAVLTSVSLAFCGYILPRSLLSIQRDRLLDEYRTGFPDFLDMQIVCIGAGASIESSLERACSYTSADYPSLARNLGLVTLELRAGKSLGEALNNLADRLSIPEARSYAAIIQQSEEFGTSLSASLRVYSEEMRKARLSRAEEKANALPVKLVLPLTVFIFPSVLGVTVVPVVLRLQNLFGS